MDENISSSSNSATNAMLEVLESGSYLTNSFVSVKHVINKVAEFSSFLNSTGRIALLNADAEEVPELVHLLFNLKKNIGSTVSELGKNNSKRPQNFLCAKCEENIEVPPYVKPWEALQEHEHFESTYNNFLSGDLQIVPTQSESSDEQDAGPHLNHEYTDSGIDQCEDQTENDVQTPEETPLGDNSFRFNFKITYDPRVQKTLYPDMFISINKFDQCPYINIQKTSPFKAVCLLCCRDLLSTKRIHKKHCLDHVLGQKHIKAVQNPSSIEDLKNYHEVFWLLNPCYQAHQVYFEPQNKNGLLCKLCDFNVPNKCVMDHIHNPYHRSTVLKMYAQKCPDFYLLDLQVECYGVENKTVEPRKADQKEVKMAENGEQKKEKNRNSPSTSKEEAVQGHAIIASVTNSGNNTITDFLPHRFWEHAKCFVNNNTMFYCTPCRANVGRDTSMLKVHILVSQHLKNTGLKLKRFTYFCEICNKTIAKEYDWMLHCQEAKGRHGTVSKSRASKLLEYECTTCKTIIFGDEVSLIRHTSKSNNARREQAQEPKLAEQIAKIFKSRDKLEEFAVSLAQEANNTVTCMQRTLDCCARFEAVLSGSLEDCKPYPFGSRVSGLGNQESDLDLFIDTGGMYFGRKKQDSVSQIQIVKLVSSILRKQKGEFEKVHEVPTARTPIVKVKHIPTLLECDLSFKHGLSVENTKFLRLCLDLQHPIAQQFILVLKKWSEFNHLSEHITTYALAILGIFYLQINNYLPSVKQLRELNPKSAPVIDGWPTINYTMPLQSMKNHIRSYEHSLPRLLKDFFDYYISFNYTDVVCPLLGQVIPRKLFEEPSSLPPEMDSYVKQLKGSDPEEFRYRSVLCIQDPFDLSHNLTKACQSNTLATFKKLCQLSYKELNSL